MADEEEERVEVEYIKPASQLDLEARLENGNEAPGRTQTVNPNALGEEDYVGTDPIYQNHATDVDMPIASEEGVDAKAEELFAADHDLADVDDEEIVVDTGLGGEARKAHQGADAGPTVWLLPGQEGYPEDAGGRPVPVAASTRNQQDEESDEDSEDEEEKEEERTNPTAPQSPAQPAQYRQQNQQ